MSAVPQERTDESTPRRLGAAAGTLGVMTHKKVLEALVGLLAALFTTFLSVTIVANALPTIIGDLQGTQASYTWVVTVTLLANAVSTPIWGKLSDLFAKKKLTQAALGVFVLGSVLAALAPSVGFLIGARVVQGIGIGGVTALAQAVIGSMVSPRERGRYAGLMGSVMAVATVGGPLLGGVLVDAASWRWCFLVCVPLAVVAMVVIERTLDLPSTTRRSAKLDWKGALGLAAGVSGLLVWVSLGGSSFAWVSAASAALLVASVVVLVLTTWFESRVEEPVVDLSILRERTVGLSVVASLAVGVALFGGNVFLGQYFQIARGESPTSAGLLTLPLVLASLVASTGAGFMVSRYGKVKPFLVAGSVLLTLGLLGLGTIDHATALWHLSVFMVLLGAGTGMLLQNLVLVVQNQVGLRDVGSASASVAFFRTIGGTVGVSALGAVLANQVASKLGSSGGTGSLDLAALPAGAREVVQHAYGDASGTVFLVAACVSVVTLVSVLVLKEKPLRTEVDVPGEVSAEDVRQ
jgi:EmrB/QacA subfamily drug resistance transporter